jgi:hypothetical protein
VKPASAVNRARRLAWKFDISRAADIPLPDTSAMQKPITYFGKLHEVIVVASDLIMRVVKPPCPYGNHQTEAWFCQGMSIICMRAASSSSLRTASCLRLSWNSLWFSMANNNDTRYGLDEIQMLYQRTHPFTLLVDITYEHVC